MGKSVRTLEKIPQGRIVTQLNGELIDQEEGEKREEIDYDGMDHSYMVFFKHRVKKNKKNLLKKI
jgi:hypothetical protein